MTSETMSVSGLHRETAHIRHGISPHTLDFEHYPLPFKAYDQGQALSLEPVQDNPGQVPAHGKVVSFLSSLLYLAYGVTAVRRAGGMPFLFRTVPSAGGLYPCHLYLAVFPKDSDGTSLYYYDPTAHGLTLLRRSKTETVPDLFRAKTSDTAVAFMVTAWLYNSAWKYRNRSVRYVMLDAGHLLENLVLAAGAGLETDYDFDDNGVSDLLGLDPEREMPLALARLNWDRSVSERFRLMEKETRPCFPDVSVREQENRYMAEHLLPARFHRESRTIQQAPQTGLSHPKLFKTDPLGGRPLPWDPSAAGHSGETTPAPAFADLIMTRRSRRNFIREPVSRSEQERLMAWVLKADAADAWHPWSRLALSCRGWEGLDDGLYLLAPESGEVVLIQAGCLNDHLAEVFLGQAWVGMASAVFLCLADLELLERAGGLRAYRYAMLASGRVGQQIYVGAEAADLGCCGIGAIYDEEAKDLLGLSRNAALLYALAAGPVKRQ